MTAIFTRVTIYILFVILLAQDVPNISSILCSHDTFTVSIGCNTKSIWHTRVIKGTFVTCPLRPPNISPALPATALN